MTDESVDWAREGLAQWLRGALGAATIYADEALEEWPRENPNVEWPQVFPSFSAAGFAEENDPASVLDRIKATSRIIDLHQPTPVQRRVPGTPWQEYKFEDDPGRFHCELCSDADDGGEPWPCPTLRWLAWGYRRSYGWQPEWAPEEVSSGG